MKKILGVGLGIAASMTAALIWREQRRTQRWENLDLADADAGDFVTLSDGAQLHYVRRDPATPPTADTADVILIHGVLDSARNWLKNVDALAQTHRVWALDLVGFGYSTRVATPTYSLKQYARHLREFMDAHQITRAHLVGHSLGGAVALEFAHDFPARVARLIAIAPATFLLASLPPALRWFARVPLLPHAVIGYSLTNSHARMSAWRIALGDPNRIDPREAELRTRPLHLKGTTAALVAMLASPYHSDLPRELARVTAPTLIVWGDKDLAVPVAHAARHARVLPNAQVIILAGAGHIPQNECPAVVNRLMAEFLGAG